MQLWRACSKDNKEFLLATSKCVELQCNCLATFIIIKVKSASVQYSHLAKIYAAI